MIVAGVSQLFAPVLTAAVSRPLVVALSQRFCASTAAAQKWAPNQENQKLLQLDFADLRKVMEEGHKCGPQKAYRLIQLASKAETPEHFEQLLEVWKKERTARAAREDHRPIVSHAAQALFKAGFRVGADEKVLDVLHQAREFSIQPTRRMMEGLIFHLGRYEQWDLLERAYLYAHVYLGKPTRTMLANMIQSYANAGNIERVQQLLQEAKSLHLDMSWTEKNVAIASA